MLTSLKGFLTNDHSNQRSYLRFDVYKVLGSGMVLMFLIFLASVYLSPLLYLGTTALKSEQQLADPDEPFLPSEKKTYRYVNEELETTFRYNDRRPVTFEYEGQLLPVYALRVGNATKDLALLEDRGAGERVFIDIANPEAEPIVRTDSFISPKTYGARTVNLYTITNEAGEEVQYGFVEEMLNGNTLWVDPASVSQLIELPIKLEDATPVTLEVDLDMYEVPIDGDIRELALLKSRTKEPSIFIDPKTNEQIELNVRVRSLKKIWNFHLEWQNFEEAVREIDYIKLFRNTFFMAVTGAFGTMIASTLVAYGFTRFRIPYANTLFIILLATIILPPQVTQIPTYIVFRELGWIGTLLPMIVPHFFSNAYNVFLLRQYMMGIPLEMDEAARVDGANPFQVLIYVIVPAARPAMVAVFLFHFLWAWNEFQQPLIYIGSNKENQVLATGLTNFSQIYSSQQNLMMAAGLLTMIVPLLVFFFAQRIFMQGVVITGVEK